MSPVRTRHHAPFFWLLFGAGGMLAALFGPALAFLTGLAVPLAIGVPPDALGYRNALTLLQHWPVALGLLGCVSLFLWHAAHRILHSLHDLGVPNGAATRYVCYGTALAATLLAAAALAQILLAGPPAEAPHTESAAPVATDPAQVRPARG